MITVNTFYALADEDDDDEDVDDDSDDDDESSGKGQLNWWWQRVSETEISAAQRALRLGRDVTLIKCDISTHLLCTSKSVIAIIRQLFHEN